jgi:integrase
MATPSKRAGQIIPKGPKKWLVRVFVGRDANGKRRYVSELVHGGKKDADAALNELLGKKSRGALAVKPKETVDQYLDRWLESTAKPSVRPRTLAQYTDTLATYVRPHIGSMRLAKLTPLEVRGMMAALTEDGFSPRTVRMAHEVLRNALGAAVLDGLIPVNPARGEAVRKSVPRKERVERTTLAADDVVAFLDVVKGEPLGAFWTLFLLSGLRPGEMLGLRWKDVVGNVVRVNQVLVPRPEMHFMPPKSDSSRRAVTVPDVVVRALAEHRKRQAAARLAAGPDWTDMGLVFCTETGGPLPYHRVTKPFKRLLRAAGLPEMRPYDLRHSCATLLLEQGLSLKVVQERLGHSTVTLTADVYAHVTPGMQQQAADVLEELSK